MSVSDVLCVAGVDEHDLEPAGLQEDLDADPVRAFRSFTADLNRLGDWLVTLRGGGA